MKQEDQRKKEIERLLGQLTGVRAGFANESFEQLCFNKLCLYFYDRDIEFIYQKLVEEGDTQSYYWLIQYLVRIERPCGFEKILLIAQNENEVIRHEVCGGIKGINQGPCLDVLLGLLESVWSDNVYFAANLLGEFRATRAVFPLMEALLKYKDDEKVSRSVLRALGNSRDHRAIAVLEEFVDTKVGKVQQEALLALGKFKELLHHKYVQRWLKSDNVRVREFICLKILRQHEPRWEQYIAEVLNRERDEELLGSVLSSLRTIRVKPLFEGIFYLTTQAESARIRMLAQALLKKIKSEKLLRWIVAKERKSQGDEKAVLLNILSYYREESVVFDVFKHIFLKSKNKRFQLIVLEYSGLLKDPRVVPLLMDVIKNDDDFAFAAAIALTYTITPQRWDLVQEILELDLLHRGICVEVFLKFILRVPPEYELPESIERTIKDLARAESEDIRYLAMRCMIRIKGEDKLSQFLKISCEEANADIRKVAEFNVFECVRDNPKELCVLLSMGMKKFSLLPMINRIFREVVVKKEDYEQILRVLLRMIQRQMIDGQAQVNTRMLRGMVLLRRHIVKQKSLFLNILSTRTWEEIELWIMMKVVNRTNIYNLQGMKVDFMAVHYARASVALKEEYLKFFNKIQIKSKAIEDAIFNDLSQSYEKDFVEKMNTVIGGWVAHD